MAAQALAQQIADALPTGGFDFYHLGRVEPAASSETREWVSQLGKLEDYEIVSISMTGDRTGLLLFLFEKGVDSSACHEMANVLASRMVTELDKSSDLEILISSPRTFQAERALQLLAQPRGARRSFLHVQKDLSLNIEAFVYAIEPRETADA